MSLSGKAFTQIKELVRFQLDLECTYLPTGSPHPGGEYSFMQAWPLLVYGWSEVGIPWWRIDGLTSRQAKDLLNYDRAFLFSAR
jgi:hypothetical protein